MGKLLHTYESEIAKATLPSFPGSPNNLNIERPRRIFNPECINFGENVSFGPGSLLLPITAYPPTAWLENAGRGTQERYRPRIEVGDRVSATANLTISAVDKVVIEQDVVIAGNVYIGDSHHGHKTPDMPYKYQELVQIAPITVGKGSWIGQNVTIMPGVRIGEFAIIGANSTVRSDVPARSIAVGSPAQVVRRWDAQNNQWTA